MRLLLVTILTAALVLTVRLADLWTGIVDSFGAAPAAAADAPPPAGEGAKPETAGQTPPPGSEGPKMEDAGAGAATPADSKAADSKTDSKTGGAPESAGAMSAPEDELSDAELKTLQDLSARRRELDAREKDLDMRAGLLAAGEKRVDEKVSELKSLQDTLKGLIKTYDEQEKAKLKSLVKIYENMKPKEAAPIFEKLDMDTLLDIIERMKERKVAPILAKMNPAKAREVTDELARRHQLSQTAGIGGL